MADRGGKHARPGGQGDGGGAVATAAVRQAAPSREDPVAHALSGIIGGPLGRRAASGGTWWTPLYVVLVLTAMACVLAYLQKYPCSSGGWNIANFHYTHVCYTDIYPLYFGERLSDGYVPYFDHPVEYPVVIGGVMEIFSLIVAPLSMDETTRGYLFYVLNTLFLSGCALGTAWALVRTLGRRRPYDAVMFAVAPGLVLAAFINWDLLAVFLTTAAMLAWARQRSGWAGVLFGLAIATKFYPFILLGPLFVLCLRAGKLRDFFTTLATTAGTWLAVNVPIMLTATAGWSKFYDFSRTRPADWGSTWYFLQNVMPGFFGTAQDGGPPPLLNPVGTITFGLLCVGVALLALLAPERPRWPQLAFLTLVAFLATNKVWSPQYVLWLLPLAVLARPRWPAFLAWQAGEVLYFLGIWWYLYDLVKPEKGLPAGLYFVTLLARLVTLAVLAGLVVRDVLRPEHDAVRWWGDDDPAGGVLDGAADHFDLRPLLPVGSSARAAPP
ncbi:MAG TPA: glycosyltransferase 87 family protein [Streptosporangiales bacterium]